MEDAGNCLGGELRTFELGSSLMEMGERSGMLNAWYWGWVRNIAPR